MGQSWAVLPPAVGTDSAESSNRKSGLNSVCLEAGFSQGNINLCSGAGIAKSSSKVSLRLILLKLTLSCCEPYDSQSTLLIVGLTFLVAAAKESSFSFNIATY